MKKKVLNEKTIITKDMPIADVLACKKDARYVLMGFGMHCFECPVHQMEKLGEAAEVHGVDIEYVLEKLNELT